MCVYGAFVTKETDTYCVCRPLWISGMSPGKWDLKCNKKIIRLRQFSIHFTLDTIHSQICDTS
jgi:hypothetical protein